MEYRYIPRADKYISRMGFGGLRLPVTTRSGKEAVDDEKAFPILEEAVRRGNVVKAHITGRVDRLNRPEDGGKGRRMFSCDYEYAVNGKKMIYRYIGYTMPPEPLTLYYIDDPKKVFPGDNINNYRRDMAGLWRALIYIVPLLLGAGVMLALGGLPK